MDLKLDIETPPLDESMPTPMVPSPVTVDQMLGVTLVTEKVWIDNKSIGSKLFIMRSPLITFDCLPIKC